LEKIMSLLSWIRLWTSPHIPFAALTTRIGIRQGIQRGNIDWRAEDGLEMGWRFIRRGCSTIFLVLHAFLRSVASHIYHSKISYLVD
jgi:hypothetical protein